MTAAPPLVGLIGKKRAGKDSVADVLVEEFGFVRVAFADPLKEAALALDPLVGPTSLPWSPMPIMRRLSDVVAAIGWEQAKDFVPEVRSTLQRLGTAVRAVVDDEAWLRPGLDAASRLRGSGGPVVITDVRYPNEAQAITEAGGSLVRITRPSADAVVDAHASETALDEWPTNFTVPNEGTLADLRHLTRLLSL